MPHKGIEGEGDVVQAGKTVRHRLTHRYTRFRPLIWLRIHGTEGV
jgi:hypothetical protein